MDTKSRARYGMKHIHSFMRKVNIFSKQSFFPTLCMPRTICYEKNRWLDFPEEIFIVRIETVGNNYSNLMHSFNKAREYYSDRRKLGFFVLGVCRGQSVHLTNACIHR